MTPLLERTSATSSQTTSTITSPTIPKRSCSPHQPARRYATATSDVSHLRAKNLSPAERLPVLVECFNQCVNHSPTTAPMGGAVEACDANRFMPPSELLADRECVGAFDTLVSPGQYQRNEQPCKLKRHQER